MRRRLRLTLIGAGIVIVGMGAHEGHAAAPPPAPTFTREEMGVAQQLAVLEAKRRDLDQASAALLGTPAGKSLKAKLQPEK